MRTFQEKSIAIESPPRGQDSAGGPCHVDGFLPWAHRCGDKAKEPFVTRLLFRWGPLMGTWHGGLSVMQMGFEGERWSLRWDLTLGVQIWGSSETRMESEGQQ